MRSLKKTGMAPATVSQIIRSPLGEAYLNGLQDRAKEDILDVRKKLSPLTRMLSKPLSA